MIEKLKHKYALSDKGANDMVRAFFAVTLANLVLMMPVGLLYFLSSYLLEGGVPKEKLPFFIVAIIAVLLLIALTTIFQYKSTFFSTYVESGVRRRKTLPILQIQSCQTVLCLKQRHLTGYLN